MIEDGWPGEESPWHEGEQRVQARVGPRDRLEEIGRRFLRAHMPEQHREFFAQLPFMGAGSVDGEGDVWASLLEGKPGFVAAPNSKQLVIGTRPKEGDALIPSLVVGQKLGLLGIELPTRRRNRVNGQIGGLSSTAITLDVEQSFGNCPKYITPRDIAGVAQRAGAFEDVGRLDARALDLIRRADTFFVASSTGPVVSGASAGTDVSHRGGPRGFVEVDNGALLIPDYAGNHFFNTFGNFEVYPKAGLLFIDDASGEMLQLSGAVEILWDEASFSHLQNAKRAWRFQPTKVKRLSS